MQTFLPYASFERSARVLDPRGLGTQRSEALIILRASHVAGYGWQHHPAVKMWRGHDDALIAYGLEICTEWVRRGHRDTVAEQLLEYSNHDHAPTQRELRAAGALPPWLGDRRFHRSHRSALVRKDPEWYGGRFHGVPSDLPYEWPI